MTKLLLTSLSKTVRLGSDVFLARTPTWALARDDDTTDEQLATPDTPRLATLTSAGEAGRPQRAVAAQRLRELHVVRGLREEEVGVAPAARQCLLERPVKSDRTVLHRCHLLVTAVGARKRPRDPSRVPP